MTIRYTIDIRVNVYTHSAAPRGVSRYTMGYTMGYKYNVTKYAYVRLIAHGVSHGVPRYTTPAVQPVVLVV